MALSEQYQQKMNLAVANAESVFRGDKYRITVLTERLLRLEYNPTGVFYDQPTPLVVCRQFEKPELEVKQDDRFLQIRSKYFLLSYTKEKNFDGGKMIPSANLRIELLGTDRSWFYQHPQVRNYKGVFVSLDGDNKNAVAANGLYSLDGFACFDDSHSLLFQENGELVSRKETYIDVYLFMYHQDFELALRDYFQLTGYPPLIPRYALGNWWCRDLDYTGEELIELADHFEKNDIPLSVLLLDRGWHLKKDAEGKEIESSFTFDPTLFPEPEEVIRSLHDRNIRLGLSVNPAEGILPQEPHYPEFAQYFGIQDQRIISFDPMNVHLDDAYIKFLLHPLEDAGVDFFWNEYSDTSRGSLPLWMLNHYVYTDFSKNQAKRGILLARNGLIASHRYPISYSGKTLVSWETLKKIPLYHQMAANIGVSWWSHDVGGYFGGIEEEELYIRYIELSVFGPILRFHAPKGRYYRKEPWRWNVKTLKIATDYLQLRHRLIPYIYTEAYKYSTKGTPLIRPFYYQYPWVYDDEHFKNQYFFGDSLMIAPILSKEEPLMHRTIHKFFIPEGIWYDFRTGKKFPGNKEYISFYRLEDYPVFAKSGSIVPLSNHSDENNIGNPDVLEIHVFPGRSNTYDLYEDDGVTSLYKEDYFLLTQIDYNYLPSNYTMIIRSLKGKSGIVPEYRDYIIRFRNTKKAQDVIAYYNDGKIETTAYIDDTDFVVEAKHVPTIGQLTINCKGKDIEIDAVRVINDDIDSILLDLQINTVLKEKISAIMFSDLPIKRKRIEIRKLKKFGLTGEYVRLFLRLLEYIGQI